MGKECFELNNMKKKMREKDEHATNTHVQIVRWIPTCFFSCVHCLLSCVVNLH